MAAGCKMRRLHFSTMPHPKALASVLLTVIAISAVTAVSAPAQPIAIDHQRIGCVVAGAFPKIAARLDPAGGVSRARVYFRGEGTAWYFVEMKPDGGVFQAALPKPKKSLKQISYYIEALSDAFAESRTPNYASDVVGSAMDCRPMQSVGAVAGVASVAIGVPAGAPAIPLGFSSAGVTSTVAAAAGGAATGGGHATAITLGVLGAGAVAGGVVVAAHKGGGGEGDQIVIPGFVYAGACTCAHNQAPPYSYATGNPIQGAVVSTTLNSDITTSDPSGHFQLVTSAPGGASNTLRASVTAPGCTTSTWAGGEKPVYLTVVCSFGPPPAANCSCVP